MKRTVFIIAMLTLLLSLNGCKGCSNQNSNQTTNDEIGSIHFDLDFFLIKPQPVERAQGNTLAETPADLQNLVSGMDIDLRNSTYLILQSVESDKSYAYNSGTKADFAFTMTNIIYPMYLDPAITNVMAKDYNDCIKSIGEERLNKGEGRQCGDLWGKTWKTRVINRLLSSSSLQNSLYEWVKPELRRVINKMDSDQRSRMRNALAHMISYTANYNHQKEKTFYNNCLNSAYGAWLFNFPGKIVDMKPVDSDDCSENPYRHLETWVYRRVDEGSMSASQINNWLRKVRSDTGL